MFIIVREVYPPVIFNITTREWLPVGEGKHSSVTLFWSLNTANLTLDNLDLKREYPDAKVVGVHLLERLQTLKEIGDRIKREKEKE